MSLEKKEAKIIAGVGIAVGVFGAIIAGYSTYQMALHEPHFNSKVSSMDELFNVPNYHALKMCHYSLAEQFELPHESAKEKRTIELHEIDGRQVSQERYVCYADYVLITHQESVTKRERTEDYFSVQVTHQAQYNSMSEQSAIEEIKQQYETGDYR